MPERPSRFVERYKKPVPLVKAGSNCDIQSYKPGDRVLYSPDHKEHISPMVVKAIDENGLHLATVDEDMTVNISNRGIAKGVLKHAPEDLSYKNLYERIEAAPPSGKKPVAVIKLH